MPVGGWVANRVEGVVLFEMDSFAEGSQRGHLGPESGRNLVGRSLVAEQAETMRVEAALV